MKSNSALI